MTNASIPARSVSSIQVTFGCAERTFVPSWASFVSHTPASHAHTEAFMMRGWWVVCWAMVLAAGAVAGTIPAPVDDYVEYHPALTWVECVAAASACHPDCVCYFPACECCPHFDTFVRCMAQPNCA